MRHADGGPQNAAVGANALDRIREVGGRDRPDLAAGVDPRRGEAGVEEADGRLADTLPAQQ
jgi:hypothetical protein